MTASSPHIVCFAPYTDWSIHSARQVTILHGLRLRGATVSYVTCDGVFSDCDLFQKSTGAAHSKQPNSCQVCQSSVAARLAAWHMPFRWLGRWLSTKDFEAAGRWVAQLRPAEYPSATYGDWPIGEWMRSSVHTHFRYNVLDPEAEDVAPIYGSYLYSGALAAIGLDRLYDEEKPNAQLLFNGRMGPTRVALEIAKSKGIRTLCEERSQIFGRVSLFDNVSCLDLDASDALWADWRNHPLTEQEIETLGELFENRWQGKSDDVSVFSTGIGESALDTLGLDTNKPVWVLFTSSLDETIDEPRSGGAFANQYDWINATLSYVGAHPDVQLIIRVHPNVASKESLGDNPQDVAYFTHLPERCPANVFVVPSDSKISSYGLAAEADLGLIWYSTIGLEMAALGRPVLRVGANWLAHCDFMSEADTEDTYIERLDAFEPVTDVDQVIDIAVAAWRFSYIWYYRKTFPFPLVKQPTWFQGETVWSKPEDLAEGQDASLDHICNVFLNELPLYAQPDERAQSLAMEERSVIESRLSKYWRRTPDR